jgi:hypothetical protein
MGGGDPAMNLLLDEVENLLPSSSPWETLGGHDELATVMFLRGAILGSTDLSRRNLVRLQFGQAALVNTLGFNQNFLGKRQIA